jgi:hypothetical protein
MTLARRNSAVNMRITGLTIITAVVISAPPGTSGLLAFGLEQTDDGIDTIERRAG